MPSEWKSTTRQPTGCKSIRRYRTKWLRNKHMSITTTTKNSSTWRLMWWVGIKMFVKREKCRLTTEIFSFSESDFFDFFDLRLPFNFFFSPFSNADGVSGEPSTASTAGGLSNDLLLVTDSWCTAWCSSTWCCSTTSTDPLLNEFSKLSAFEDVIDDDSVVETVFFFDVVLLVFTDFLTDFLTTVVSDSKLSTAD